MTEPKQLFNYYPKSNKLQCAVSVIENVMHRDFDIVEGKDKPAFIEFYDTTDKTLHRGNVKCKRYFKHGKYFRTGDKPTEYFYFDVKTKAEGKVQYEFYRNENGELHRDPNPETGEDLPAVIEYYPGPKRQIKFLGFYRNGKFSRSENKPCYMQYYLSEEEPQLEYEVYCKDGVTHREPNADGIAQPAYLKYDKSGKIWYEGFYQNGIIHKEITTS